MHLAISLGQYLWVLFILGQVFTFLLFGVGTRFVSFPCLLFSVWILLQNLEPNHEVMIKLIGKCTYDKDIGVST